MASYVAQARAAGWLHSLGLHSLGVTRPEPWAQPDIRRKLQLALAGIWLLDAILQFQAFMFGRGFAQMLAATAAGNPRLIAGPIHWLAGIVAAHGAATNALFASIQLVLAIGIALRPTVRVALAGSIVWALAVWWLGEGLGGILNGTASPANGAPGAVVLYALLAVLLWPRRRERESSFVAGRSVGPAVARALWLLLWGSLAYCALQPATRAPGALGRMISAMASGQPAWLADLDRHFGVLAAGRGPVFAMALAIGAGLAALGVFFPWPAVVRGCLILTIVLAAVIWLAEGLGGMLTGTGTDPNTGPLLALLALCYWPLAGVGQAVVAAESAS